MKEQTRGIPESIKFCQKPSKQYLEMLEKCGGDPRSAVGRYAINTSGGNAERGWVPTWDSREIMFMNEK